MSWLDFAFGVVSKAAKQTSSRLRDEYVAGRENRPPPRPPQPTQARRPAAPPTRVPSIAWWQVLQLPKTAGKAEVTAAYRELIRKNHPDKVAHLSEAIRQVAEQETRRINAAYEAAQHSFARPD